MRNLVSETIGSTFNQMYHNSGLTPAAFMDTVPGTFDVQYKPDCAYCPFTFHVIHEGFVVSVYYIADRNEWYAKF